MPVTLPQHSMRFLIPPSLGTAPEGRGQQVERYLSRALGKLVEVAVAPSYEALAKDLLADKASAGWAPPFVCARLEAMGVKIVARGVRGGASTYRSALVCAAGARRTVDSLQGLTVAWVDRDSVAGYLLPLAHLRALGKDPARLFAQQQFVGSYKAALEAVADGKAQVCSVFAPPEGQQAGVEQILPGRGGEFEVIAFTEAVPNDGVAVSVGVPPAQAAAVERALLAMHETPEGQKVLADVFHVERFEAAPRLGYRALYRVALASL